MRTADGFEIGRCRSCQGEVIWARTRGDKAMPVDAAPCADGNVELRAGWAGRGAIATVLSGPSLLGGLLRKAHFASCPHADSWRTR